MMRWLALMSLVSVLGLVGCQKNGPAADPSRKVGINIITPGPERAPVAEKGDTAYLQYVGTLKSDGTRFDGNIDNPQNENPLVMYVGMGAVIKGWEEGVLGMRIGETRELDIPWEKAYGPTGNGSNIPPKADLKFTITMLDLIKKDESVVYDMNILKEGSGPAVKKGDTVAIHVLGRFVNGKEFDNTREQNGGKPLVFEVGKPEVILGVDDGILGMKKGEIRRLRLPPRLGWGEGGTNSVPSGQIMIMDIELMSINGQ